MIRKCNAAAFLSLLSLVATAQVSALAATEPAKSEPQVPSWRSTSQPLDPTIEKSLDSLVRPIAASGKHVGVVVGIIDGDQRYVVSYGRVALGKDTPPNGDTVYEIGSITKTFTTTALAAMCAKGTVKLSDPVSKWLPASARVPSYKGQKITLEQLATHTSGLPRVPDNFVESAMSGLGNPYAAYGPNDMYKFLRTYRLQCAPGTKSEYSNLGAGLLGFALTRAQGTGYEALVTSLVCKPIGLKDTIIGLSKDQRARLAPGYTLTYKNKLPVIVPTPNWTFQDCFAGAGALRSTANDMLTYLAANMGLVKTPISAVLESTHKLRFKEDDTLGCGLGWQTLSLAEGAPGVIWHDGGTGGYCSFIGFCKERRVGMVLITNTSSLEDEETDEDTAALGLLAALMSLRSGK